MFGLSNRFVLIISSALFAFGTYNFVSSSVHQRPGVLVASAPLQVNLEKPGPSFRYKDFLLTPLANYKIQARILSIKTYWWDAMSDLVPIDFAVGWQKMSDTSVLNKLTIDQANRFYVYSWKASPPIHPDEIIATSANMHLIPADKSVYTAIKKVRVGQVITLTGDLVEASNAKGFKARSSMTRFDSGAGACEIMWVTEISSP